MRPSFNVRVYGLCFYGEKFLALKEMYAGTELLKLPGGGLEFGEGLIECLEREMKEELNLEIHSTEHFYTQEGFVVSRFNEKEQLLTIYYRCEISNPKDLKILEPSIQEVLWIDPQKRNPFELPIDIIVFDLLQKSLL